MTDNPTPESAPEAKPKRTRKPPKPMAERRKSIPKISIEKYNEMFAAYLERQSAPHVARTCQVAERTARRYIDQGDPKRKLMSLKERLAKVNDLARQRADYDLVKARAEFQKAARAAFVKTAQAIQLVDAKDLTADKIPEHLNKLLTVIERTFGEAEHSHEVRGKFANWSLAEIRAFLDEGIDPDK